MNAQDSLRERKKARTRASLREHALRLFREQGYQATTVEQIAAAAEVSPSTFFRYFPTKEDLVLQDDLDTRIVEAFARQPPELGPVAAVRAAMREAWASFTPGEWAQIQQGGELSMHVPEIRARATFAMSIEIEHHEIDRRVCRGELNVLERERATVMIEAAPACDKIIADGKRMFAALKLRYSHFVSCDHGEDAHASVAAASVIAKVVRDDRFNAIRARYEPELGPITGGGYSNVATTRWLRAYVERYGCLPDEARKSWPYPQLADLLGHVRPLESQLSLL